LRGAGRRPQWCSRRQGPPWFGRPQIFFWSAARWCASFSSSGASGARSANARARLLTAPSAFHPALTRPPRPLSPPLSGASSSLKDASDRRFSAAADARSQFREFTAAELRAHTGAGGAGPILLALDGVVYDMASHPTGPDFYGPGKGYSVFAGRDATFGLATMSLNPAEWPAGGAAAAALTPSQLETVASWAAKFNSKYEVKGWLAGSQVKDAAALREKLEGPAKDDAEGAAK